MEHEILIVDDEPDIRLLIEGLLRDEGYETRVAANSDQALAAFRARRPSLIILDIWLQARASTGSICSRPLRLKSPVCLL